MSHTRAPLNWYETSSQEIEIVSHGTAANGLGEHVASVWNVEDIDAKYDNARLFVAAPELLNAIKKALPFIDDAMDAHTIFNESAATPEC